MIDKFFGEYRFLSNFYPCRILYEDIVYPSTEHAYQAAKTFNQNIRLDIACNENPAYAKKVGKTLPLREDWERVKDYIMLRLLRKKFSQPEFKELLLATGDQELVEGNTWGDVYWGVCKGVGENKLGKLLMQVRKELKCVKEE